jgi:lipopolysaccharide transport system ATP-binding protein
MYVRLAFSVAAHLNPDILVLDEVLAVGDVAFQKKCLGRMESVARDGRTVILVSHNLQTIRSLCTQCAFLSEGRLQYFGDCANAISAYEKELLHARIDMETGLQDFRKRRGSGNVRFNHVEICDVNWKPCFDFRMGESIFIRLRYVVMKDCPNLYLVIGIRGGMANEPVATTKLRVSDTLLHAGSEGELEVEIPPNDLRPGRYPLFFWLGNEEHTSYDMVDGLTPPILMTAPPGLGVKELGFDPTRHTGFFTLKSRLLTSTTQPARPKLSFSAASS